jgi:hypothetical protein
MRYTVVWEDSALDALAAVWMRSSNRNAVRAASIRVDRELAVDPDLKGTDFYGDRLLYVAPLSVSYHVEPADMLVRVLDVW